MMHHPEITKITQDIIPMVQAKIRARTAELLTEREKVNTEWMKESIDDAMALITRWDTSLDSYKDAPRYASAFDMIHAIFPPTPNYYSPLIPRPAGKSPANGNRYAQHIPRANRNDPPSVDVRHVYGVMMEEPQQDVLQSATKTGKNVRPDSTDGEPGPMEMDTEQSRDHPACRHTFVPRQCIVPKPGHTSAEDNSKKKKKPKIY